MLMGSVLHKQVIAELEATHLYSLTINLHVEQFGT